MKKIFTLFILFLFFANLEAQLPGCTSILSPANAETNISPAPFITLKWNPVQGASYYNIYLNAKSPPTKITGTTIADTFNIYNAQYNSNYYWYIVPVNSNGGAIGCGVNSSTFTTGLLPPTPTNDDCSGATEISSTTISGTTLGATQSLPAVNCGGYTGFADDDIWYQFTALSTGTVDINFEGSPNFDGVLQVFKGNCGSLTSLDCSDATEDGGNESVTINAIGGTNYKVRLYSFGSGLSDRGNFTITATGSALPVSLINFKGEEVNGQNIISWSTATEINNQGFELQYSFNGKDFKKLNFVISKQSNGNSNSILNYQFIDSKNTGGNVYYRLVQIDKDGKPNFSKVILVKGGKINSISISAIYPNPAKDKLNLVISSPENNNINIIITDLAGKIVRRQAFSIMQGGNNFDMDISALSAGTYFIKADCKNGGKTPVSKFVKE